MVSTLAGRHTLMKGDYLHVSHQYDSLVAHDFRYRVAAAGVRL